jgi:hypothetical protein
MELTSTFSMVSLAYEPWFFCALRSLGLHGTVSSEQERTSLKGRKHDWVKKPTKRLDQRRGLWNKNERTSIYFGLPSLQVHDKPGHTLTLTEMEGEPIEHEVGVAGEFVSRRSVTFHDRTKGSGPMQGYVIWFSIQHLWRPPGRQY